MPARELGGGEDGQQRGSVPAPRLLAIHLSTMVEQFNDELSCVVCLEICVNAVEADCCSHLLCEACAAKLSSCPYCRAEPLKSIPSKSMRRLIGNMPIQCSCGFRTTRGEFATHEKTCRLKSHKCQLPHCSFQGPLDPFLAHIVAQHPSEALSFFASPPAPPVPPVPSRPADRDCISFKGRARIGTNGKYYCGQRLNGNCGGGLCCDGYCGPKNGCNCEPCMKLDIEARALPRGYLVNREGRMARRGEAGLWYCGAKVMHSGPNCDGWCGPDDGPQCGPCQRLQFQQASRYSSILASWHS